MDGKCNNVEPFSVFFCICCDFNGVCGRYVVMSYRGVARKREREGADSGGDGASKPSRAGGHCASSIDNIKRWCEGKDWCERERR